MGELATVLLAALVGGVVGAWATSHFQAKAERKRELDREAFRVYEQLLLLREVHREATTLELGGMPLHPEGVTEYHRLARETTESLRQLEDMAEAEDILRAMWSLEFAREEDRNDALTSVLVRLGERVNPTYHRIVSEIGRDARELMLGDYAEYRRRRMWIQPLPALPKYRSELPSYSLDEVKSEGRAATWTGHEEEFAFDGGAFLWHPFDASPGVHVYSWQDVPDGKELPTEGWQHIAGCDCRKCRELW